MRVLVIGLMALLMSGCIAVGWSNTAAPTVGQQLVDLKTARERGAITEQEYEQKKAEILRKQ